MDIKGKASMELSKNAICGDDTDKWKGRDVVSINDFETDDIMELFRVADIFKNIFVKDLDNSKKTLGEYCKGKIMACVFYEPSTRTNCSFSAAMMRLGGQVMQIAPGNSSVKKGETLQDTMKSIECYSDILVLRHPEKGSVAKIRPFLKKPIINAGDGAGEHPTQALLDLYTILSERSNKIDGLVITMLGDLKYGRTTHSLANLLSKYSVTLNYVTPEGLEMPPEVIDRVSKSKCAKQYSFKTLETVLDTTDVLYVTRIQKERFESVDEYNRMNGKFIINSELLKKTFRDITIMHPLPRVGEISEDVDCLPGAAYFRQMENGMYVRMAIIAKIFGVA